MELFISKPCSQNWDNMDGSGCQRFCERCQCEVHDFTNSSVKEVQDKFLQSKGVLCGKVTGKFMNQQYQSNQLKQKSLYQLKVFFLAALLGFGSSLFLTSGAQADIIISNAKHQLLSGSDSLELTTIKGIVKDEDDGEALPFANVTLLFNDTIVIEGTSTNFDGYYELRIDPVKYPKVNLQVSYVGYEKKVIKDIVLTGNTSINITIKAMKMMLGGFEPMYQEPLVDPFRMGRTISREEYMRMPK